MQKLKVPENKEPSELALELSAIQSSKFDKTQKRAKGQFFTSINIAKYMASLAHVNPEQTSLKILDPGCGTLILSSTLIEIITEKFRNIVRISLDCFEIDLSLFDALDEIKESLVEWSKAKGVSVEINIHHHDFLLNNWDNSNQKFKYDLIISNPPYFKLNKEDPRLRCCPDQLSGQQNIYSLFLLQSARLLKSDGQLIYIIPLIMYIYLIQEYRVLKRMQFFKRT